MVTLHCVDLINDEVLPLYVFFNAISLALFPRL